MNTDQSIVEKIKECSVLTEPYKYAEIDNLLPDSMYDKYLT